MVNAPLVRRLRAIVAEKRVLQFILVGGVGTVIDYAVLIALIVAANVTPELAKLVGAEVSIVVMFAINERWTFAGHGADGSRALLGRLLRSNLVRASGLVVAVVTLSLLFRTFGVPILVANAVGIAAGFVVNYTAECHFTWGVGKSS